MYDLKLEYIGRRGKIGEHESFVEAPLLLIEMKAIKKKELILIFSLTQLTIQIATIVGNIAANEVVYKHKCILYIHEDINIFLC